MQAMIPITVAIRDDTKAMRSVFPKAAIMSSFLNKDTYHFPVKPPHLALVLDLLNDSTIKVTIGA